MSTQPCGCDPEFVSKDGHTGWLCQEHRNAQCHQSESEKLFISTTTTRAGISVDFCVRDLIPDPGSSPTIQITLTLPPDISVHSKSVEFYQLLADIALLHSVKQRDYGTAHDPFANVRASAEWGIAPWVGALARLNDKVKRLQKFAREGNLANESAEDSMLDIAVYSLIALILFKEQR